MSVSTLCPPPLANSASSASSADSDEFRPFPASSGGRPLSLDEKAKKTICQWLLQGATFKQAAAYVACHPETIRNERRRDASFDREVRRAVAMRNMEPLETIRRQAKHSWRAATWLIKYREEKAEQARAERAARLDAEANHNFAGTSDSAAATRAPENQVARHQRADAEISAKSGDQGFSPSPPHQHEKPKDEQALADMLAFMDQKFDEARLTPTERAAGEPLILGSQQTYSSRSA